MKKYIVKLDVAQRQQLEDLISRGQAAARKLMHARVLLKADQGELGPGWSDEQIAEALEVGLATIGRIRQRFADHGVDDALNRRPQPERPEKRTINGEQEAHLIALCCGKPPEGHERWTMRLLADRFVQLGYVDQVSHKTVWVTLRSNKLKPWLKEHWCIPPKANDEFVYRMEDVLEVYTRPYDARFPQICLDEGSKQLLAETREPLPIAPGKPKREDYEYEREGTCRLFLACEPLSGKRFLQARERRTKADWADFVRELIEVHYPQAEKVVLVLDNLNTHTPAYFYEVFAPAEAWRLSQKLEVHSTPKHGSWLNMAEIELSVLARQCLNRRLGTLEEVSQQVQAWQEERNQLQATINWRFTAADARIKLKRLYPIIEE
ncbi:MAG TPA: IS630 family transposase [Ktedonobacteraceae bacterium]|nr:IS630 family transposase [Ktedonobacteraceae bacterium]